VFATGQQIDIEQCFDRILNPIRAIGIIVHIGFIGGEPLWGRDDIGVQGLKLLLYACIVGGQKHCQLGVSPQKAFEGSMGYRQVGTFVGITDMDSDHFLLELAAPEFIQLVLDRGMKRQMLPNQQSQNFLGWHRAQFIGCTLQVFAKVSDSFEKPTGDQNVFLIIQAAHIHGQ